MKEIYIGNLKVGESCYWHPEDDKTIVVKDQCLDTNETIIWDNVDEEMYKVSAKTTVYLPEVEGNTKMKYLIVVDMQNDFINGSLRTKEAEAIIPRVKDKVNKRFKEGYKIIFTVDTHEDNYLETREGKHLPVLHCIENTKGWQIPPGINIPTCRHIYKDTFGVVNWTMEESWLEDIPVDTLRDAEEIELIGLCTDICVISNALILRSMYDCEIYVDASCCAGTTPELHKAALDVMKSCQINIIGE